MRKSFKSDADLKKKIDLLYVDMCVEFATAFVNSDFELCKKLRIRDYVFEEIISEYNPDFFSKKQLFTIKNVKYISIRNNILYDIAVSFWLFNKDESVSDTYFTIMFGSSEATFVAMQRESF